MTTTINGTTGASQVQDGIVTPSKLSQPFTAGTAVASTSGTSIDFTGIPSWVKRITISFVGISTNGVSPVVVQIGDSGGVEATGYLGGDVVSVTTQTARTAGFGVGLAAAAGVLHGAMVISLHDLSTQTWVASFNGFRSDSAISCIGAGSKSLSLGPLDRVRITTIGGADTFDAGSINILYEG